MSKRGVWFGAMALVVGVGLGFLVESLLVSMPPSWDPPVVAAVVTAIGVVVTVVANQVLGARSERRLRLDAALEAGKLLSLPDGGRVNPSLNALRALVLRIVFIQSREKGHFKNCLAGFVEKLAPALDRQQPADPGRRHGLDDPPDPHGPLTFFDGRHHVTAETLREIGSSFRANDDTFYAQITWARREALHEWAMSCRRNGVDATHGRLVATARHDPPVDDRPLVVRWERPSAAIPADRS